jgi:trehalose-phosphatase
MSISEFRGKRAIALKREKHASKKPRVRVIPINARRKRGNPRPLFAAWDEIEAMVCGARGIVVMTDFDGTLAGIRKHPEQVRLGKRVRRALEKIIERGALVGIVSGRSLPDVRSRVGIDGICYVGCHGYSLQATQGHSVTLMNRAEEARLPRICRALEVSLHGLPGIRIEAKEAGIAIHYRNAERSVARRAHAAIRSILAHNRRLHLLTGKKVWEILPGPGVNKWTAIQFLLALENRRNSLLCYVGDDAPDEHVFARMRGISIVVGKRKHTAARFFVESTADVRRFLEELARAIV